MSSTNLVDDSIMSPPLLSIDEKIESDIIRSEMNLEKHSAFLFPPPKAKNLDEERKKDWIIKLEDGRKIQASITITPLSKNKVLTSRSYDVFLAVIKVWELKGKPTEVFKVSLSELARAMGWKSASGSILNGKRALILLQELFSLKTVNIKWSFSFNNGGMENASYDNQNMLGVQNYKSLKYRLEKGDVFKAMCELQFSPPVLENLSKGKTVPVNLKVRQSIKSAICRMVYSRVDNNLTYHPVWEISDEKILEDYSLNDTKKYKYSSNRKILLEFIQKNLNKTELSCGDFITSFVLPRGKFWKMQFVKVKNKNKKEKPVGISKEGISNQDEIDYYVELIGNTVGSLQQNKNLYTKYVITYPRGLIERALGEYKEEIEINPALEANRSKFFTIKMHSVAHNMGKEWIKDCGKSCKFRIENNLFLKN